MRFPRAVAALAVAGLAAVLPLSAQQGAPVLDVPQVSQRATVSQVVGLTTIALDYGRPAVKGRAIWGALVPWGEVWRTGANINTVLSVSSRFRVGGVELPAGRYGLHTIPTQGAWTVILNKEASNWGSFSYDSTQDAVRFRATPRAAPPMEQLQFTLDDPADSTVTVTMRWEKLALPFTLTVPTHQVVVDSLRHQLAGLQQFWPTGWLEAARWALANNTGLDQAAQWADRAIAIAPTFGALSVKASVLERQGRRAAADSLRARAMTIATEADVNALGYQYLGERRVEEALVLFRQNVKDYPKSWNAWDSLGEALGVAGRKPEAVEAYRKALAMAPAGQQARIRGAIATLSR